MFKKVDARPGFPKLEHKILDFWEKNKCFEKLQKKLKGKKHWSFIDGPMTANNPMGVHHAWGRTYKDVFQRYKAMQGFDQRWQNGFDCQGLWVEVEVEKELGFKSKKDIINYGLENFSKACRARVDKYSKIQTEQSKRLGQWMDWENSYYTMSDTNIEYIWYFLRKCYQKGWLYRGTNVMPWCTRCGTSLSQHELADVYKEVIHDAVYIQLPIKDRKNEYLLVWTTTPWTLTSNTACAVNPNLTYVKVKLASHPASQYLILAKARLEVLEGMDYEVVEEFKGQDLVGLEYIGPFDELEAQKDVVHKIIPWKEVSEIEGTGIVHIAPGCGQEDHQLGKEHKLAEIAPLDEFGIYKEGFAWLTGRDVHEVRDDIYKDLKKKGYFFKSEKYKHRYPHCWRCGKELVFRLVEEWFIKSREIREPMMKEAKKVKWLPSHVGKLMQDWLINMQDWCISRKRFWGLPLPFYPCKCGEIVIIESKEELKKKALDPKKVDDLLELHRPWIDEIKIKCPKCGKPVSRIPEVGDCWLDAGIVPFSTLKYLKEPSYWQKWFPAKLVCEMREQVRLWFYSLLFMSVTLENKASYETAFTYEKLLDEKGQAMHKSLGNVIWFDEAAEKMGADVMRWLYCAQNPAYNVLFGYKMAGVARRKLLLLWNVYLFFVNYAIIDKFKPSHKLPAISHRLDKWILSSLNTLILEATNRLEKYDLAEVMRLLEKFLDDLSTWYVRRSRRRFWKAENKEDKRQAYETLYEVLTKYIRLLAPILPFVTEEIYQNLVTGVMKGVPESVHLCSWPKANEKVIDKKLNEKMQLVRDVVALGLSLRVENKIKVKQPLEKLEVKTKKLKVKEDQDLLDLIKDELNVKEVSIVEKIGKDLKTKEEKDLEVGLDIKITPELKQEGIARELIRHIQNMRKRAEYSVNDQITSYFQTDDEEILEMISNFGDYIKQETISLELEKEKEKVDVEKEVEINGLRVWLGVKK